jgi:hypothetical protein
LQSAKKFQVKVEDLSDSPDDIATKQCLIKRGILDKLQEAFSAMQVSLSKPGSSNYSSSFHRKLAMEPKNGKALQKLDDIAENNKEAINNWMESPEYTIDNADATRIVRNDKYCEFCVTPCVLLHG